jgi:hypothetical protein
VLRPNGTHIATARVSALPPRAVALSKTRLAVQESLTLDLYNPVTGARTKSLALGAATAMQLAGVSAKLALFRSPEHVVLVRLSDGKLISLPLQGAIDPSLTDAGLFYAYNRSKATMKGRIVFEPTDKLLARF